MDSTELLDILPPAPPPVSPALTVITGGIPWWIGALLLLWLLALTAWLNRRRFTRLWLLGRLATALSAHDWVRVGQLLRAYLPLARTRAERDEITAASERLRFAPPGPLWPGQTALEALLARLKRPTTKQSPGQWLRQRLTVLTRRFQGLRFPGRPFQGPPGGGT